MGRQSAGGRASTRIAQGQQYDYGCQFFRATSHTMKRLVAQWTAAGVVAEWRPRLGLYDARTGVFKSREQLSREEVAAAGGGHFGCLEEPDASGSPLYVGQPSMGALVEHLAGRRQGQGGQDCGQGGGGGTGAGSAGAGSCTVQLNQRVQHALFAEGRWVLGGSQRPQPEGHSLESGADLGSYDALVLTDSQVARPGAPGHITLEGAPPTLTDLAARLAGLTRVPLFTLMLAWDTAAPPPALPAEGLVVAGGSGVQWVAVDSSKPGRRQPGGLDCWVAVTTPHFAAQLVEEDLRDSPSRPPPATAEYRAHKAERIWGALRADLAGCLGTSSLPRPAHMSAHRWSSALCATPLDQSAAWDGAGRWAACGDFCTASGSGPGAESAVVSGVAAAEAVAGMLGLAGAV